jgi:hypothetical protein
MRARTLKTIVAAAFASAAVASVASATTPGESGQIAFRRYMEAARTGSAIFVINPAWALAAGNSGPSVLNGVYRIKWTEQELIAAGMSKSLAHGDRGVITMTLRDGRLLYHQVPPSSCAGTYAVSGSTVSFKWHTNCTGSIKARWSLRNGQLRLHVVGGGTEAKIVFGTKPWKKIG